MMDTDGNDNDGKDDKQLSGTSHRCNYVIIKLFEHPQPPDIGTDVSNAMGQTTFDDLSWRIDKNQEEKNDQLR
jgi:hypothetical protein